MRFLPELHRAERKCQNSHYHQWPISHRGQTAEGSIDEQTLEGKGPFGVAFRAKQKGLPVIGIAGKVPLRQNARLQEYFDVLMAIGNMPSNMSIALSDTSKNITRTGRQIGNLLAIGQ